MKRIILKTVCAAMALCFAAAAAGCGNSSSSENTQPTSEGLVLKETEPLTSTAEVDLKALHYFTENPEDPFSGAWHITAGVGADLQSFVFMFDGKPDFAYLMCGTMGYIGKYTMTNDSKNGAVMTTHLMFGLDGTYTYKFSEDNKSAVLTNVDDSSTTTIEKLANYSYMPVPELNPRVDEELLGAWADEMGNYLYFDKNGIMYESSANVNFYLYTYSAHKGTLNLTYYVKGQENKEATYKVEGDKLTYDGYDGYRKITNEELV